VQALHPLHAERLRGKVFSLVEPLEDLRQKVVSDPMTADMALRRMDAPAKSALARGVMQDAAALKDGAKILDHLTTNEAGIMRVLKAYDPTTAAKVFADAKEMAEITRLIQQTPVGKNALASQQHLADLTKGLPELRAVVEKIQAEIASGKTFDQLAAEGRKLSKSPFDLVTQTTGTMPTGVWNTVYNVARLVMNRVKGGLDKKLGAEVAAEGLKVFILRSQAGMEYFFNLGDSLCRFVHPVLLQGSHAATHGLGVEFIRGRSSPHECA
jgi:dihydrofolate reductase